MSSTTLQSYTRIVLSHVPWEHWVMMTLVSLALTVILLIRKKQSVYGAIAFGLTVFVGLFLLDTAVVIRFFGSMKHASGYNLSLDFYRLFQKSGEGAAEGFSNIAVFVPFGFFLAEFMASTKRLGAWWRIVFVALFAFGLSLCIECLQLVLHVGFFEVIDLVLNTVGGVIGAWLSALFCIVHYSSDSDMIPKILRGVLFFVLLVVVIAFFVLVAWPGNDYNFNKFAAIATLAASISSAVVGIATVKVMTYEEKRDRLQNQPLYSVKIEVNGQTADNEEFSVDSFGKSAKGRTLVHHYCFLEITYTDTGKNKLPVTKYCPLIQYFGCHHETGNLEGSIVYSSLSGDNNKRYFHFYNDSIEYQSNHPGVYLNIQKRHFFEMEYTDIFGVRQTVVKDEKNFEVDVIRLAEVQREAQIDAGGKSFSILKLDLDEVLQACFPEEFRA